MLAPTLILLTHLFGGGGIRLNSITSLLNKSSVTTSKREITLKKSRARETIKFLFKNEEYVGIYACYSFMKRILREGINLD